MFLPGKSRRASAYAANESSITEMTVTPPAKITEFRNRRAKGNSCQISEYAAKLQCAGHSCAGSEKTSFSVLNEVRIIQTNGKTTKSATREMTTQPRIVSASRR